MPEVLDWSGAEIGKFYRPPKKPVTMRLDTDIISWLKGYGRGYQTKVNVLLRHAMMNSFGRARQRLNKQTSRAAIVAAREAREDLAARREAFRTSRKLKNLSHRADVLRRGDSICSLGHVVGLRCDELGPAHRRSALRTSALAPAEAAPCPVASHLPFHALCPCSASVAAGFRTTAVLLVGQRAL